MEDEMIFTTIFFIRAVGTIILTIASFAANDTRLVATGELLKRTQAGC